MRAIAAVAVLLVAACESSAPSEGAAPTPTTRPPHAITVGLNLTVAGVWEAGPEPQGCHGIGPYDDLGLGTPVELFAGNKKLASATVARTKNWIASCSLVATFDAVPAAKSYRFKFGEYPGQEVPYATVAKNWNVVVTP